MSTRGGIGGCVTVLVLVGFVAYAHQHPDQALAFAREALVLLSRAADALATFLQHLTT
ncbi:hypothetical protein [Saccharothrix coeruleofusca]|uniref:Uncharacterized protein n=1 Tax=Saccharothrix coeruleofusca TaxID=33919 RepID=A0A918EER5_9PSEU|nr:hypothetical protein [Saccharothrix coeruleofusca]MBP2339315.1 hypothetical protein [Saccharothrix coeruleofusca]GGP58616.1 hypothetical protein GCM10010185_33850 [Saccharothrix coeruleofusca]